MWLVIAFIGGFAVNQILTGLHLNPMQGKAFMSAEYGGLPVDCTSFYGDTINCWRDSFSSPSWWWDIGGGYGGATSDDGYDGSTSNTNNNSNGGEDLCAMGFDYSETGEPCNP